MLNLSEEELKKVRSKLKERSTLTSQRVNSNLLLKTHIMVPVTTCEAVVRVRRATSMMEVKMNPILP